MGTAYIRLKFTPVVKYFPIANSNNCWLEIIPTVSSIENFDKIEWSQQKGSVEYIVPMTYKITLRKQEPEHRIRMYYSCIDLLPSVSSLDLSAGDVYRCISDNFIVSKAVNENLENTQDFDLKVNCKKNDIKVPNKIRNVPYLAVSKEKLFENGNIRDANNNEHKTIEKDSILQGERVLDKVDKNIKKDRGVVSQINADNKNKENLQKKLCITKVCKISTTDEITSNNYVDADFNTMSRFNPSVTNIQTKNIEFMENINRPLCDPLINCFVRVEPELRVAQFVQNMEKEVFPLKVLLNELLKKCTTLGLQRNITSDVLEKNKYKSLKNKCNNKIFGVQKEVQSNRVVYSIVSDS